MGVMKTKANSCFLSLELQIVVLNKVRSQKYCNNHIKPKTLAAIEKNTFFYLYLIVFVIVVIQNPGIILAAENSTCKSIS